MLLFSNQSCSNFRKLVSSNEQLELIWGLWIWIQYILLYMETWRVCTTNKVWLILQSTPTNELLNYSPISLMRTAISLMHWKKKVTKLWPNFCFEDLPIGFDLLVFICVYYIYFCIFLPSVNFNKSFFIQGWWMKLKRATRQLFGYVPTTLTLWTTWQTSKENMAWWMKPSDCIAGLWKCNLSLQLLIVILLVSFSSRLMTFHLFYH